MENIGVGIAVTLKNLFSGEAKKVSGDMKDLQQGAEHTTQGIQKMEHALNAAIGTEFAHKAKEALEAIIEPALEFDEQIAHIQTLMDAGGMSVDQVKEKVLDLSTEFGTNFQTQTAGIFQLLDDGINNVTDSFTVMESANRLAKIGMLSTGEAIGGILDTMTAWGMGVEQADHVANAFQVTNKLGKTSVAELSRFMRQAAPLASELGISFEEVNAAIVTMTNHGIGSRQAFMALNQTMQGLTSHEKELKPFMKAIGEESISSAIKHKGLAVIVNGLSDAYKDNRKALSEFGISGKALTAILKMTGEGMDEFSGSLDKITNDTETLKKAFEDVEKSPAAQLAKLRGAWEAFKVTLGEKLVEALGPLLIKLNEISERIALWIKDHPRLTQAVALSIGVIGGLVVAAGALAAVFAVVSMIGGAVIGTFGGIVAGIGVAVGALYYFKPALANAWAHMQVVVNFMKDLWTVFAAWISPIMQKISDAISQAFETAVGWIKGAVQWVEELIKKIGEVLGKVKFLKDAWNFVGDAASKVGGGVKSAWNWAGNKISGGENAVGNWGEGIQKQAAEIRQKEEELNTATAERIKNMQAMYASLGATMPPTEEAKKTVEAAPQAAEAPANTSLSAVRNPGLAAPAPQIQNIINVPAAKISPSDVFIDKDKIGKIMYQMSELQTVRS